MEAHDAGAPKSATHAAEAILLRATDFRQGIGKIQDRLIEMTIRPYFQALLDRHGITIADAVRRADLDRQFGRQILTGVRMARRDYYIRLAIGMGLTIGETQSMLNFLGIGPIYAVRERDAAIFYAIERRYSLMDTQLLLEAHGLPALGDADAADPDADAPPDMPATADVEMRVRNAGDFDAMAGEMHGQFARMDVSAYFDRLLEARGLTRAQVLARAGLKESIGYQLLSGIRTAKNRDAYIRIAMGIGLDLAQTQQLLKHLKKGALYPLKVRDAALVFCIGHGYTLPETQRLLAENGLPPL